jgi:hypothetical protein
MKLRFSFACICFTFFFAGMVIAQDQGITSQTHHANVGKIVWAKERIKFDVQDRIQLATAFSSKDPIYGRVYLSKSLQRLDAEENGGKCPNRASNYWIKGFTDGQSKGILNDKRVDSAAWTVLVQRQRESLLLVDVLKATLE